MSSNRNSPLGDLGGHAPLPLNIAGAFSTTRQYRPARNRPPPGASERVRTVHFSVRGGKLNRQAGTAMTRCATAPPPVIPVQPVTHLGKRFGRSNGPDRSGHPKPQNKARLRTLPYREFPARSSSASVDHPIGSETDVITPGSCGLNGRSPISRAAGPRYREKTCRRALGSRIQLLAWPATGKRPDERIRLLARFLAGTLHLAVSRHASPPTPHRTLRFDGQIRSRTGPTLDIR